MQLPPRGGSYSASRLDSCAMYTEKREVGKVFKNLDVRALDRYYFLFALNPICLRVGVGCSLSLLSSSNTTLKYLSCVESLRITAANLRFSSSFDSNICRSFTNARMMVMLTSIARSLLRTLDNIATPCSVKTYGKVRLPPRPCFEIANCDLKLSASSF